MEFITPTTHRVPFIGRPHDAFLPRRPSKFLLPGGERVPSPLGEKVPAGRMRGRCALAIQSRKSRFSPARAFLAAIRGMSSSSCRQLRTCAAPAPAPSSACGTFSPRGEGTCSAADFSSRYPARTAQAELAATGTRKSCARKSFAIIEPNRIGPTGGRKSDQRNETGASGRPAD